MRDSSLGPLLAVFYGCGFLAGFNENLVNMALVAIMGDFSIDAVAAQWLVTGYMIAVTVVVTCMAYLYRRLSMRTLFFAAAALSIAAPRAAFWRRTSCCFWWRGSCKRSVRACSFRS